MPTLASKIMSRLKSKVIQEAANSKTVEAIKESLKTHEKEIFQREEDVEAHLAGYSDNRLNEYIIAKSRRWLESLNMQDFVIPPHVANLLLVIQASHNLLRRPLKIIDFGGGAPTVPLMLEQLGLAHVLASYKIVESPAFVEHVPAQWHEHCNYSSVYDDEECDLLILSSVLPYLSRGLVDSVLGSVRKTPPSLIYFGRTSFLPETYPQQEAFTIQESRYRDHGAQVDVGMADVENNIARYVKRHFKWSSVAQVLDPLGYQCHMQFVDDTGLENIKGLGLYTKNSLWRKNG